LTANSVFGLASCFLGAGFGDSFFTAGLAAYLSFSSSSSIPLERSIYF